LILACSAFLGLGALDACMFVFLNYGEIFCFVFFMRDEERGYTEVLEARSKNDDVTADSNQQRVLL